MREHNKTKLSADSIEFTVEMRSDLRGEGRWEERLGAGWAGEQGLFMSATCRLSSANKISYLKGTENERAVPRLRWQVGSSNFPFSDMFLDRAALVDENQAFCDGSGGGRMSGYLTVPCQATCLREVPLCRINLQQGISGGNLRSHLRTVHMRDCVVCATWYTLNQGIVSQIASPVLSQSFS